MRDRVWRPVARSVRRRARHLTGLAVGLFLFCSACASGTAAAAPASKLLARLRAISDDSTSVRQALVKSEAAAVRVAVDSLVARTPSTDAAAQAWLEILAQDYQAALGDSILLHDIAFVKELAPAVRKRWFEGVQADEAGMRQRGARDYTASVQQFETAAARYRDVGDLRREAVVLGSLGVAWWLAGDFDAAGAAYERALDARRRLGDLVLIGRTLNALGSVAMRKADYPAALRWYEQARDVRDRAGDRAGLGVTLSYIGNVHYLQADLEGARASYLRALEVLGDDARPADLHPARLGLANVHWTLGEYHEAQALYEKEIALLEGQGDARQLAITKRNLANCLWPLGDYAKALDVLNEVRDAQIEADDTFELAATYNTIGSVYQRLGDRPKSLEAYLSASRAAETSGNSAQDIQSGLNQALIYLELAYLDRALETYENVREKIEASDRSSLSWVLSGIALVKREQGKVEEALGLYRQALFAESEHGVSTAMPLRFLDLGLQLSLTGDLTEGRRQLREALERASYWNLVDVQWKAHLGLGDSYERAGVLDGARVHNQKAIEILEGMRGQALSEEKKASLLGSSAFVYEAQLQVLAKLHERDPKSNYNGEAFSTAERGKARALLDQLAEAHVDLGAGLTEELGKERDEVERSLTSVQYLLRKLASENAAADTLAVLKKRRTALEERRTALLDRIRIANPRYATLDAGKPIALAELRRDLLRDNKSVLLEYALGDSASYLWLVTAKSLVLYRLPSRAAIEAEVEKLRTALRSPAPATDANLVASAASLYRMLLEPARKVFTGKREIYIVPDGALQSLPFEVLLESEPQGVANTSDRAAFLSNLPYAFRSANVRYGPSATVLAVLARQKASSHDTPELDLLAVGNPVFEPHQTEDAAPPEGDGSGTRAGLAPLPFTGLEVEAIGSMFDPARRTLLLQKEAREKRLLEIGLSRYRWLHFATHGLVDERRPERSSLALSFPEDASEDGFLQASEIYGLDLDAELVVLSACETGLGKTVRGEGVLGLPRAFLFAGAHSVVVSMWSVSDRSTSEYMQEFYRQMVRLDKTPAEAMMRARERLRRSSEFAHPFYWAPFVLIGPG